MDLIKQAQKAALKSGLKPAQLAPKARVSVRWLQMLLAGTLKDPSYKRLQAVIRACEYATKDA